MIFMNIGVWLHVPRCAVQQDPSWGHVRAVARFRRRMEGVNTFAVACRKLAAGIEIIIVHFGNYYMYHSDEPRQNRHSGGFSTWDVTTRPSIEADTRSTSSKFLPSHDASDHKIIAKRDFVQIFESCMLIGSHTTGSIICIYVDYTVYISIIDYYILVYPFLRPSQMIPGPVQLI